MNKIRAAIIAALFLAGAGAFAARRGSIADKVDPATIAEVERANLDRVRRVVDAAGPKSGMTVLDLGAGTGQEAFELAQRLQGTGKVFAAEIEPELVDFIRAEAKRRGLSNLQAVQVRKGADAFYAKRKFDLIFLYDAVGFHYDQANALPEIAASLAPGGTVALAANDGKDISFYAEDFKDWPAVLEDIAREPLDSPVGKEIRRPIGAMLDRPGGRSEPLLRRAALFHMNRVLEGQFFAYFTDGPRFKPGLSFTKEEERYASWLLRKLLLAGVTEERGFINKRLGTLGDLQRLNKLILVARFRKHLAGPAPAPYLSTAPEIRWARDYAAPDSGLKAAGIRLDRSEAFPPFQSIRIYRAE